MAMVIPEIRSSNFQWQGGRGCGFGEGCGAIAGGRGRVPLLGAMLLLLTMCCGCRDWVAFTQASLAAMAVLG